MRWREAEAALACGDRMGAPEALQEAWAAGVRHGAGPLVGVAATLFISVHTAGVHVSRILGKLGVASRTEAASLAYRQGIVHR